MARINLLPWREERRVERKKEFLSALLFVVMLAVLSLLVTDQLISGEISYQKSPSASTTLRRARKA